MLVIDQLLKQNMSLRRNNNFLLNLQYKPGGSVFNTANFLNAYLQVRPYKGSTVLFLQANLENQMITFSGSDGGIYVNIPYYTTRDLPTFDNAFYDLIVITKAGQAITLIEGAIELIESVGRIADNYKGVGSSTGTGSSVTGTVTTLDWDSVSNKPSFATVATTGNYTDLQSKPVLFSGIYTDLKNRPLFSKVAISGLFIDLINIPASFPPTSHTHNYTDITNAPNPLVFRDTWLISASYNVNNVVLRNGSSYVCIIANVGLDPEDNYNNASITSKSWQLLARAGVTGSGDTGTGGSVDGGSF